MANNMFMKIDSIQKLSIQSLKIPVLTTSSFWFWVALVELILILVLIIKLRRKHNKSVLSDVIMHQFNDAKNSDIDMSNLMNSINKAKGLYKELSKKCHPDKFVNTEYQDIANDIFQEMTNDKRNFEKLSALKIRAIKELNIKF